MEASEVYIGIILTDRQAIADPIELLAAVSPPGATGSVTFTVTGPNGFAMDLGEADVNASPFESGEARLGFWKHEPRHGL